MFPKCETIDEKSSARAWTSVLIARPLRPKNKNKNKTSTICKWRNNFQPVRLFVLFFGRRGRAIRTEVHARADDFSSMVSHFGNIDPSSSVFGSQLLAVSNAYRVTSPQTLRLCISYEISLYVLLPMTIQLSMSGQPSHPMKSLTSHKAPCRYELAHSKQFLVGEQLCKAQLTICTT